MMNTQLSEERAFLVLNALPGIGPITLNRLLQAHSGEAAAVLRSGGEQPAAAGISPAVRRVLADWSSHFNLEREEQRLADSQIVFLPSRSPAYPGLLREIHDPPIGLYCLGPYRFEKPSLAIIGSRRTTLYGRAVAERLAGELARLGFCIVSGLARGIDTAAHQGALAAGGSTVAVLGCGLDIIYPPENLDLYRRIGASGLVMSEFPFGRRADRQSFPMRNRVISGLCQGVIVVESDAGGGSMITARFAGEQGRQVFAVPGRIDQATSRGCHQLIRDGAVLVTGVEDILQEFGLSGGYAPAARATQAPEPPGLSEPERRVLACFAGGNCLTPDALVGLTDLPAAELRSLLLQLELKRAVVRGLDGSYEASC